MSSSSVRAGQAFIELTTRDSKLVKGLRNAQARLNAFGTSVTGLGTQFAGIAGAAALPFGYMTRTFANFDDQMRIVEAKSEATDEEFKQLTETAKRLGRETSYTAAQVAQGMAAMASGGFKAKEIMQSIGNFLNLDRATGMNNLGLSAEIAASAMKSFRLTAQDSTRIVDVLTATANGSAQTLGDVGEALKMAAPNARMANATLEDTCSMLGVLANLGIKGSMAGSALAKTYEKLASDKGADFLKKYKIDARDGSGNLRSMRDILTDIAKVTKTMGSAEKISFLTNLFDVRGVKGGGLISGNLKGLDEMMDKIANSGGLAEATAKKMDSGIGGSFRILMSALEGVGLEIGEVIGRYIQPYVSAITGVLGAMARWVKSNSGVVIAIVRVVAVVGAAGAALLALGVTAKVLAFACGGLAVALQALTIPIVLVKSLLLALKAVAIATWTAMCTPALLFAAALGVVAVAVGAVTGAFDTVWESLKTLASGFASAFGTMRQVASESFEVIKSALAVGDIAGAARVGLAALRVIWLTGLAPLKKAWYEIRFFLTDTWSMTVGDVMKAANSLWYGLLIGLKTIGAGIANAWDAIWNGVIGAFESTVGTLKKKWIQFKGFFDSSVNIDAEIRKVDEEIAANRTERARRSNEAVNRRDREVNQLSAERDAGNQQIDRDTLAGMRANRADYDRSMREAAKNLADAQKDWRSAMDDVKKSTAAAAAAPNSPAKKLEERMPKLQQAQAKIETDVGKSAGIFGASNIDSLMQAQRPVQEINGKLTVIDQHLTQVRDKKTTLSFT